MKKGQNTKHAKEVFQTGLTEACRGNDALTHFLNSQQSHRERLNVTRKKKSKK